MAECLVTTTCAECPIQRNEPHCTQHTKLNKALRNARENKKPNIELEFDIGCRGILCYTIRGERSDKLWEVFVDDLKYFEILMKYNAGYVVLTYTLWDYKRVSVIYHETLDTISVDLKHMYDKEHNV